MAGRGQVPGGTLAEDTDREAGRLRGLLADEIVTSRRQAGRDLPEGVEAALRTVPRHRFAPGTPLAAAYANDVIITKKNERGRRTSSVSAPWLVAAMLAQLDVRPGQSVLEIGSGGYNAALLRELAGPGGSVTTMDIDPEITGRARACLDAAGYRDVRTACGDGETAAGGDGAFDRIIVTFGAWDIPPAWSGRLAPGGRLVVPLRTRGRTWAWALDREDGHLAGRAHEMCGFLPAQGAGEHRGRSIPVDGAGVGLWTDEPADMGREALTGVLATARAEAWTGVTAGSWYGQFSDQNLWLLALPEFCVLTASQAAIDQRLVAPYGRFGTPALAGGGSLAYRAGRPVDEEGTIFEAGAYGHGPRAAELAECMAAQIRIWDRDHRPGPGPVLTVHPAGTPDGDLPAGYVLNKRHTTLVLSWPGTPL
jgi:protein-L-isoaspartate(D-aspartate) O-methyltransferase